MTNEELAQRIQGGETALMADLWEQTARFFKGKAYGLFIKYRDRCASSGVELDDIYQCGYLALVEAVKVFDPQGEYKLLSYIKFPLIKQIRALCGITTSKRDPLNESASLNETVGDDESETTRLDLLEDPNAALAFGETEDAIYNTELRAVIDTVLDQLPADRAAIVRGLYFEGKSRKEIAAELGVSNTRVYQLMFDTFLKLKRTAKLRLQFEENVSTAAYRGTGLQAFRDNGSSVERAVIKADELNERMGAIWNKIGGDGVDEHND